MASFPDTLHPAHVQYLLEPPPNTLDLYFQCLESLADEDRDDSLGLLMRMISAPRMREPVTGNESISDLTVGPVTYETFKEGVKALPRNLAESFLVNSFVTHSLRYLFRFADERSSATAAENHREMIEHLNDPEQRLPHLSPESVDEMIEMLEDRLRYLPTQTAVFQRKYNTYCEKVVKPLLSERREFPIL